MSTRPIEERQHPSPPSPEARPAADAGRPLHLAPRPITRGLTRRQLLQAGTTTAAAFGMVGAAAWLVERRPAVAHAPARMRDHRVERPAGAVEMAVARGPDPAENARKAIEALGGMGAFVRPGERVVIKPNVGWNRTTEQAANTNPEVVAQVVRMVRAAGASKVWVCDVPVNNAERCFERSGIRRAAGEAGAIVLLPEQTHFREVAVAGKILRSAEILAPLVEADKVINLPIAKHHGSSGATLSMKNWYGIVGGARARLHQSIHETIVDLAALVRPTLTVLDATRVLLANGPSGGSLDDVLKLDTVVAAVDEVALDAFGATLLRQDPAELHYIALAELSKLGTADFESLKRLEIAG